MNQETWKEVRGFEGLYEVSDLGRVRSLGREVNSKNGSRQRKRRRILTQEVTVHGYCRVRLYRADGTSKHVVVHRLVMDTFAGPSELQVNHKNEIKTDNRLANLEYCTSKQNCNYGTRNQKLSRNNRSNGIPVVQKDDEGHEVRSYNSIAEASRAMGVSALSIRLCCDGATKTSAGFK